MAEKEKYSVRSVLNETAKGKLSSLEQAKKWAMNYLQRPHSEKELRDKLAQKGCSQEDIDTVTELCLGYGFVDDKEYACMIARYYAARKYGPERVRMELHRRGVNPEYWDLAMEELPEDAETLDQLLTAKLQGKDVRDRKERDKVANALARRGFSWDDIHAAFNRMNDGEE